jgi:hypothetical protein
MAAGLRFSDSDERHLRRLWQGAVIGVVAFMVSAEPGARYLLERKDFNRAR